MLGMLSVMVLLPIVGALFALQLFLMMSRRPSPGAGDNLNSTSMNIEVAKYFARAKDGQKQLQRTRLVILSTDGDVQHFFPSPIVKTE